MKIPDRFLVDGAAWPLRRAWPRAASVCPLELQRPDGTSVVGQWFASADVARHELDRTPGAISGDDPRLVLQPDGADRKLPGLAPLVRDGAELLAHRPGRRAVVRTASGTYIKVTRAGRADDLVARHRQLADLVTGIADVPSVVDVADDRVELGALPGEPPLARAQVDRSAWLATWDRTAAVLVRLATGAPDGLPIHDGAAEAEVARNWVARAVATDRLPERDVEGPLAALTREAPSSLGVAHRDLHDGQLLVADGRLGLLDPDTLAGAEPALDLANLLVHLQLRVEQGFLAPDRASEACAVLREAAADVVPGTAERLPAYIRATRLRLAAVYSLRPRWHELALRWYDAATEPVGRSADGPTGVR